MPIRLVLVDDQELVRTGLAMVLAARPEVEVVGEADDGETALELLRTLTADVVLMDVRMPRLDGVAATRELLARSAESDETDASPPRVLILTTFDLDDYVYEALRAGASGFLLKDTPVEELVAAIGHIHAGDAVVSPSTTRRLLAHVTAQTSSRTPAPPRSTPGADRLSELTPREEEVLLLVARGLSNAEIAAELVVSEGTVKTHVGRILTKLDLRDRVQAVVLAYESGLVGH